MKHASKRFNPQLADWSIPKIETASTFGFLLNDAIGRQMRRDAMRRRGGAGNTWQAARIGRAWTSDQRRITGSANFRVHLMQRAFIMRRIHACYAAHPTARREAKNAVLDFQRCDSLKCNENFHEILYVFTFQFFGKFYPRVELLRVSENSKENNHNFP